MRLQLFSLFVLTVTLSARAQPLLPIETAAIYDLVSTFNILPTGWNVSDPSSVCSWPGIECSDRYIAGHSSVAILDFSRVANAASLVGSIPQSIKDLSQMRIMFLNPARFPSELPDQFPPQMHSLTAAGCGLQGTLPPWIINLGRIQLQSNELRGPLPEFTGFTQLPAEMWFTNNRFAGSIPESWLTIPVASDPVFGMYINGNKLYGFINNSLPEPLGWDYPSNCDFSSNFFCHVTNTCIANGNKCLNSESDLIGYIIDGSYPATPIGSFSTFGTLVEGDTFINTKTFDCPKPPGIHRLTVTITLPFNVTSDTFDQLAGELSQWTVSAVQSGGVRTWTIAGDLACPVNSSKVVLSVYRGNPVISIIVNDEISAIYIVTSPSNTGNYAKWPNVSLQVSYTTANVDVAALLDFVSTCNTVPYGWDISHPATVCQWPNVECWEGRVAIVDLQTVTPLNCELTESLGDMTHLQYLKLEHIGLRGTIPASMSNMSALYFLSLNNNPELHGTIPESFGNLSNLNQLFMSYCNLSGTLPPSLGSLVNLGMLDLEGNNLRGPIPESFNNLINLYYVKLTYNKLAGWIPQPFINMMPQFNRFNVNNNKFYGCYGSPTFPTDLQEECNIQRNNFCCIPSHCADPGVTETQHCLGSPSSVMIWMSQGLYPPNIEFTAAGASNTYSMGYMVEGDTYRMTSSLSCNDPAVQARGVNVTITLQPLAVTFNNSIRTDTLTFGDPSRWTMVANTNGTYTVNGLVQCNSYLDTTNFTQLQQTYVVGVSVWQGSLVVGVLLQNDVAGAWASYATTPNGGIVTSNTENWSGSISIELSLA